MRLSILICSLVSRAQLLDRLLKVLQPQLTEDIEVLTSIDEKTKSVGLKRNELLLQAKGDYIVYIDDDDLIATDYISKIIAGLKTNPDCLGIEGIITINGSNPKKFIHSLQYKSWYEADGVYYRNPNHISPVKRELALQAMFPEKNFGEDSEYSAKLLPLLKTEVVVEGILYYYEFRTGVTATQPKKPQPKQIIRRTQPAVKHARYMRFKPR